MSCKCRLPADIIKRNSKNLAAAATRAAAAAPERWAAVASRGGWRSSVRHMRSYAGKHMERPLLLLAPAVTWLQDAPAQHTFPEDTAGVASIRNAGRNQKVPRLMHCVHRRWQQACTSSVLQRQGHANCCKQTFRLATSSLLTGLTITPGL